MITNHVREFVVVLIKYKYSPIIHCNKVSMRTGVISFSTNIPCFLPRKKRIGQAAVTALFIVHPAILTSSEGLNTAKTKNNRLGPSQTFHIPNLTISLGGPKRKSSTEEYINSIRQTDAIQ